MNAPRSGKGYTVAVVGATGAVGGVLLEVLAERNLPIAGLRALASERSAGTTVSFAGTSVPVTVAEPGAFDGADFVFFAATGSLSKELAPAAVERGAVVIDKSGTWRMHDDVPLVVPEVNADALETHRGIVACPNCTTIGFVMALEPLRRRAGLDRVVVTTLQAVSGAGLPGLNELEEQELAHSNGSALEPGTFAAPIARNVVPLCDQLGDDGYTAEEAKLLNETRKILSLPELEVSMTCVRVPVPVGHSASVLVHTTSRLSVDDAAEALDGFPGVEVYRDGDALPPTPADVEGRDEVLVGRLRRDLHGDGLWLWQVSDNLRKGAATNAVQIAEEMHRRGLVGTAPRVATA